MSFVKQREKVLYMNACGTHRGRQHLSISSLRRVLYLSWYIHTFFYNHHFPLLM